MMAAFVCAQNPSQPIGYNTEIPAGNAMGNIGPDARFNNGFYDGAFNGYNQGGLNTGYYNQHNGYNHGYYNQHHGYDHHHYDHGHKHKHKHKKNKHKHHHSGSYSYESYEHL